MRRASRHTACASKRTALRGLSSARVHIELTEMLRCPERHEEGFLVLSTGEMLGRMVRSGVLACPKCGREYPVVRGVVQFSGSREPGAGSGAAPSTTAPRSPLPAPDDVEELPVLSLLACETMIPLRQKVGRAAVVGPDRLGPEWLAEARRVLLPGRRLVIESEGVAPPAGLTQLALGHGLFVGERRCST